VLVPVDVRVQSAHFVSVIHTRRMPDEVYRTGLIRFAPVERAVADAARGMRRPSDVQAVVAEAVQRGRCPLALLARELAEGPSGGSRHLRQALAAVGAGIRSSAEADLKELIGRTGLAEHGINVLHFVPSSIKKDPVAVSANLRGAIMRGNAQPPLRIHALPSLS
jgi:hypothetical protein